MLSAIPLPHPASARQGEAGFTLIELTVSVFMLILLTIVMATYYPRASLNSAFGGNLTYATLLGQEQMEEIKAKTFSFVTPTNYSTPTAFTYRGIIFTRKVIVTMCNATTTAPCPNPITSTQSSNLAIVSVTVSWQEPSTSSAKAVTLTTVVHNYF